MFLPWESFNGFIEQHECRVVVTMKELHVDNVVNGCLKFLGINDVRLQNWTPEVTGGVVDVIRGQVASEWQDDDLLAVDEHGRTPALWINPYQRQCHGLHPASLVAKISMTQ